MTITGESLNSWADQVADLASEFTTGFEARFGYPPGDNRLVSATPQDSERAVQTLSGLGVPGDLLQFYSRVESVSLPDLDNGFFIHSADSVADGMAGGQPTEVVGAIDERIVVFGSDGGGGLCALTIPDGRFLVLRGGALVGPRYDVDESGVQSLPGGLWGFLESIRAELVHATSPN
ncbi:hypothetical protein DN069_38640 [Streptacidiphilus pinicola]|uniref:SMI1/KNR4 family protein n=1 Tax=Streptacidiphilus pinicola TaxID=2219663 RepID=A0A2X0I6W3_9ACTN|nr:hypothetical protein [Streptacidiphilus pinicola]RAG80347.1 hypothetical protein DN069_38640 [Streptacidiphilus pinicola]